MATMGFIREELVNAKLELGGAPISLADYATTGLRIGVLAPSGGGKTSAGLLIAEQLADQGWVSVLVDPEGELAQLYGEAVKSPEQLRETLQKRDVPIVVVPAHDTNEFVKYVEVILEVADSERKPLFLMCDETTLFSATRKRVQGVGSASDLLDQAASRGRKRRLDIFVTAQRYSGSLSRAVFANLGIVLIGRMEDPTAWSAVAPKFRGTKVEYSDLAALSPGEFFVFSRTGLDRYRMPMAKRLAAVAPVATIVAPALPQTYVQWDRAMRAITVERLQALTQPVTRFLSAVAGLTAQQCSAGDSALLDELEARG
jgi:hypothetical protein